MHKKKRRGKKGRRKQRTDGKIGHAYKYRDAYVNVPGSVTPPFEHALGASCTWSPFVSFLSRPAMARAFQNGPREGKTTAEGSTGSLDGSENSLNIQALGSGQKSAWRAKDAARLQNSQA